MHTRSSSPIRSNGLVPLRPSPRKASGRRPLSLPLAALLALGLAGALFLTSCDGGPGPEEEVRLSPDVVALKISEGEIDTSDVFPDYRLIVEMTNMSDIALDNVFVDIALRDDKNAIVEDTGLSSVTGDPLEPDETQIIERSLATASYDEYTCYTYSVTIGYDSGGNSGSAKSESKSYPGTCG